MKSLGYLIPLEWGAETIIRHSVVSEISATTSFHEKKNTNLYSHAYLYGFVGAKSQPKDWKIGGTSNTKGSQIQK